MTLTTPALLFSSISLLMLAYTNRFLTLAKLVRELIADKAPGKSESVIKQVINLQKRLELIKHMQVYGVLSFLFCTLSMFSIFLTAHRSGFLLFGASLIFLTISLVISLYEVLISTDALKVKLSEIEKTGT